MLRINSPPLLLGDYDIVLPAGELQTKRNQ